MNVHQETSTQEATDRIKEDSQARGDAERYARGQTHPPHHGNGFVEYTSTPHKKQIPPPAQETSGLANVQAILRRSHRTTCQTCGQRAYTDPETGTTYCGNRCDRGGRGAVGPHQPGAEWDLVQTDANGTRHFEHTSGIYTVSVWPPDADGAELAETLTLQGPEGDRGWNPCKNPCEGLVTKVLSEVERRAAYIQSQQRG